MLTVSKAYRLANEHLQNGLLSEAEKLFRTVSMIEPSHFQAHRNLARLLRGTGRLEEARIYFRNAIRLNPDQAELHYDLGNVLVDLRQFEEAASAYEAAIAIQPSYAEAFSNLGLTQRRLGNFESAVASYRQSLAIRPNSALARYNLGNLQKEMGDLDSAIASYREALRCEPDHAEAINNLGIALRTQGKRSEAVEAYERALNFLPESAEVWCNLGNALEELDRKPEAIVAYRRALAIRPDNFIQAYVGLGICLWDIGEKKEAGEWYVRAFQLEPENPVVRFNRACFALYAGEWKTGWILYEARWETEKGRREKRNFTGPRWRGQKLNGERVLLFGEQGIGDSIQMIRYAKLVGERGGVAVIQCPRSVHEIFRQTVGVNELAGMEDNPAFDFHVPLMSLPFVGNINPETYGVSFPYVQVPPNTAEIWSKRTMKRGNSLRVGLVWAGNPSQAQDARRSASLDELRLLLEMPDVDFFSLQVGPKASQIEENRLEGRIIDLTSNIEDFADTAALIRQLDLVITVCTSVAHLAGALAVSTWTMLPFAADWRWMADRSDSIWYPTMRLFRQGADRKWAPVVLKIRSELEKLTAQHTPVS